MVSVVAQRELIYSWLDYPILLKRKRIKNVYLRVNSDSGAVEVSAPQRMTLKEIEAFVLRNLSWLEQKRQQVLQKQAQELCYVTGEFIPLWGQKYPLTVTKIVGSGVRPSARLAQGKIVLTVSEVSTATERRELINELYRLELMTAITKTRREHELRVGQVAYEYRVRDMKTRWGTCNVRARRIWLSLALAKYHPRALAYVMVHELTHLLERGHNARFWRLVEEVCPNWREIRQELTRPPV